MNRIKKEIIKVIIKDLKKGILLPLPEKIQNDDTLQLEFRENYISIYYRGGCISKLEYKNTNIYQDYFDDNYKNKFKEIPEEDEEEKLDVNLKVTNIEECKKLVEKIIERKEYMNCHFANIPKREREYQQAVERENNDNGDSNYYIADIEYANLDSRFDMIAVQRKDGKSYEKLKPAIIEMKYGEKAISNKCGLYDHYRDVKNISKEELTDIIEDAEEIMKYKYELGLIKAKDYIDRGIQILNNGEIDFIFFLSGITDKHKTTVLSDLKKIQEDIMNEGFDSGKIKVNVKFYCAFTAGNIMFDNDILTIEQFLNLTEYRKNIIK